jgi:hypothetical protein
VNFAKRLEEHATACFARVPGELSYERSPLGPDCELRFSAAAFDYTAVLRVSDKRLLADDRTLFAEVEALAEQTIESILHGAAPLRPGYPKAA